MSEQSVPKFLTAKELSARWLGQVAERTIQNWRHTGDGPPFKKIGGKVLYALSDIERWEAQRTVNSTSEYRKN